MLSLKAVIFDDRTLFCHCFYETRRRYRWMSSLFLTTPFPLSYFLILYHPTTLNSFFNLLLIKLCAFLKFTFLFSSLLFSTSSIISFLKLSYPPPSFLFVLTFSSPCFFFKIGSSPDLRVRTLCTLALSHYRDFLLFLALLSYAPPSFVFFFLFFFVCLPSSPSSTSLSVVPLIFKSNQCLSVSVQ